MNDNKPTIAEQMLDKPAKPKAKPQPPAVKQAPEGIAIRTLYFKTTRDIGRLEQNISLISSHLVRDGKPRYRVTFLPNVRMYLVRAWPFEANPDKAPHAHEFLLGHDEGMTAEMEPRT